MFFYVIEMFGYFFLQGGEIFLQGVEVIDCSLLEVVEFVNEFCDIVIGCVGQYVSGGGILFVGLYVVSQFMYLGFQCGDLLFEVFGQYE